ncbi:hypothetical protein EDD37DRAFT_608967 [Exophiala viscosa]|uniref:Uncharacterized protein n=1 Tax=Exophiala viscosa TaxID=2486360 RepID=A0AAN6IEM7_9EURO|nr:hypothetical protein EDD36DRAFT_416675 [Exophiala viscosa]KAI1623946.1 hypothetical protein EDD37DRAFT_608967 [Exophiala viscosa]
MNGTFADHCLKPDYTLPPTLSSPAAPTLGSDSNCTYQENITESICAELYNPKREPPYGLQYSMYSDTSMYTEEGHKKVRGSLTESRYLTFGANGYAVDAGKNALLLSATKATSDHESIHQQWILHEADIDATTFTVSSVVDGANIHHTNLGGSKGYTIKTAAGLYLTLTKLGVVLVSIVPTPFDIYSDTYTYLMNERM